MDNVQIYYHCTYKGSGGGFCLGQLIIGDQTSGNIKLSEEDTNQFIRNCFNYGTVRKACGILPQEPQKYFLLVKKLTAQGKTPEEPEHYSMNIALVTESRDQFRSWLTKGDDSEQEIAETVRDSMDTDDNRNDFSFTVRAEQAVALAEKSFKSLFVGCPLEDTESTTCVEKYYAKTDLKKLAEDLQLADSDKVFEKSGSGKWVVYCKKKTVFLQPDCRGYRMDQKETCIQISSETGGSDRTSQRNLMAGVDPEKISKTLRSAGKKLKELTERTSRGIGRVFGKE